MEADYSVADSFVVCTLYSSEQLDGNPLLLALHERRHDFVDAFFVETSRLDVVDVFFVILSRLLLARLLRNGSIPRIGIVNAKCFNDSIGQFRRAFGLCLATDEAGAVRFTTVARLRFCAISIDVVVEDEFFAGLDIAFGKNTHAKLISDHPLVDVAVRITRVVAESSQVAFLGSVHEFALCERHKVEVLDAFFVVLLHLSSEHIFAYDFADVLKNEVVSSQIGIRAKTIAFLLGLNDGDVCVLFSLEALVLACDATIAIPDALHLGGAVDAVRVLATGMIGLRRWVCNILLAFMKTEVVLFCV